MPGRLDRFSKQPPDGFIDWEDHYHPRTRKIPFRIRAEVFESDEAIVAVFGHEMVELAELRSLFDLWPRRRIPAGIYGECVLPNIRSNYHDRAWDYADELVQKMRES
jgi:hypothetical protein